LGQDLLFLSPIVTKPCGGKFGAPTQPAEPNILKISAETTEYQIFSKTIRKITPLLATASPGPKH
jgi:hypothetical protein